MIGVDEHIAVLNKNGESCLHLAAANGHSDVVSYLLEDAPILNKQVSAAHQ